MLDSKGNDYNEEAYDRPPPYSPDFIKRILEKDDNDPNLRGLRHAAGIERNKPLMLNPDQIEHGFMEKDQLPNTFPGRNPSSSSPQSSPKESSTFAHMPLPPFNPKSSRTFAQATNGEHGLSNSSSSLNIDRQCSSTFTFFEPKRAPRPAPSGPVHRQKPLRAAVSKVQKAMRSFVVKAKAFEEKHEVRDKTKKAAVCTFREVKKVAATTSRKVNALNEKHQIVEKCNAKLRKSASFVWRKCSRQPQPTVP